MQLSNSSKKAERRKRKLEVFYIRSHIFLTKLTFDSTVEIVYFFSKTLKLVFQSFYFSEIISL